MRTVGKKGKGGEGRGGGIVVGVVDVRSDRVRKEEG